MNTKMRVRIARKFSAMSGVSNNMLVSLSLAHLDSKKFDSNQAMVDFLTQSGFLNFEETSQTMGQLDRSIFLDSQ
jgi:hypothetical protein